jgi:D-alanine-D-alanine ligase
MGPVPAGPDRSSKGKGVFLKVAILLGGDSSERDVSLETGRYVAKALLELDHEILPLDPARGEEPLPENPDAWGKGPSPNPPEMLPQGGRYHGALFSAVEACRRSGVRVIFNALHGGIGEDGTIQAYLDLVGIPYTGSGMSASALAMDKAMAKRIFEWEGIRVPRDVTVGPQERVDPVQLLNGLRPPLDLPVVVKPSNQGSTVGLRLVNQIDQLEEAFREAERFRSPVMMEQYIPGRELTVAILEDRALPVVEIIPEGGLYDYESKYTDGKSRYITEPDLAPELVREIQDMSLEAFQSLGCCGYARVDVRLDPGNVPYLLEVNTLPGMTSHSLVPKAAQTAGIDFVHLVEKIVLLAVDKNRP